MHPNFIPADSVEPKTISFPLVCCEIEDPESIFPSISTCMVPSLPKDKSGLPSWENPMKDEINMRRIVIERDVLMVKRILFYNNYSLKLQNIIFFYWIIDIEIKFVFLQGNSLLNFHNKYALDLTTKSHSPEGHTSR